MRTPLRCGMEYPRYSRRKRIDEPGSPVRKGGVVHVWTDSRREDHGKTFSPHRFPLPSFLSFFLPFLLLFFLSSLSSFLPSFTPFSFGLLTTSSPSESVLHSSPSLSLSLSPSLPRPRLSTAESRPRGSRRSSSKSKLIVALNKN